MTPPAPTTPATVEGPVHKVPCPWCGKPGDLRGIQSQIGQAFEAGCTYGCDHCKGLIKITRVAPVTIVQVKQHR